MRSISTGELLVVKLVKEDTVVLETVKEGEQALTGGDSLYLNEHDEECGCEYECSC